MKVYLWLEKLISETKLFKCLMISYVYSFGIWAQLLKKSENGCCSCLNFFPSLPLNQVTFLASNCTAGSTLNIRETTWWGCSFRCCKQPNSAYLKSTIFWFKVWTVHQKATWNPFSGWWNVCLPSLLPIRLLTLTASVTAGYWRKDFLPEPWD